MLLDQLDLQRMTVSDVASEVISFRSKRHCLDDRHIKRRAGERDAAGIIDVNETYCNACNAGGASRLLALFRFGSL